MVKYAEAIKRPFSDWKKLGIGALMGLIPFVNFVTGLFMTGYGLVCARTAKSSKLPEWKNWGSLFVNGLLAAVIGIIYFIPALAIGLLTGGAAIYQLFVAKTNVFGAIGGLGAGIVMAVLIAILTIYVLPAAITLFAIKEKFGAAFELGIVFKKAFTGTYLLTWIVYIAYAIATSIVMLILNLALGFTVVLPFVVSAIWAAIIGITCMTMFGQAVSEA